MKAGLNIYEEPSPERELNRIILGNALLASRAAASQCIHRFVLVYGRGPSDNSFGSTVEPLSQQ